MKVAETAFVIDELRYVGPSHRRRGGRAAELCSEADGVTSAYCKSAYLSAILATIKALNVLYKYVHLNS